MYGPEVTSSQVSLLVDILRPKRRILAMGLLALAQSCIGQLSKGSFIRSDAALTSWLMVLRRLEDALGNEEMDELVAVELLLNGSPFECLQYLLIVTQS